MAFAAFSVNAGSRLIASPTALNFSGVQPRCATFATPGLDALADLEGLLLGFRGLELGLELGGRVEQVDVDRRKRLDLFVRDRRLRWRLCGLCRPGSLCERRRRPARAPWPSRWPRSKFSSLRPPLQALQYTAPRCGGPCAGPFARSGDRPR
jgi:hypothetical protein